MKDLIIGCATRYNWGQLKYWINSINASGFKGDKVIIIMESDEKTVRTIENNDFTVVRLDDNLKYKGPFPVHVERFVHIYNYLSENTYRYVVTTDVKDVIFQNNPSEFLENNLGESKILIGSESLIYKNEPWGNDNLMRTFGNFIYNEFCDKEIFNVGTLAGEASYIKDLALNIFLMSINRPIPIVDQAVFNVMMHTEPWKSVAKKMRSETGWAAQLGTTGDPSKLNYFKPNLLEDIPVLKGDKVFTSEGKEFCIVHQYDRVPTMKNIIEKKYE